MEPPLGTAIKIDKAEFKARAPQLRGRLIDAQFALLEAADFPVIVLLSGMDELGRSATAKQLLSWMDARHLRLHAAVRPSLEELDRPRMWRFWRALPSKGHIGVFLNAWYEAPAAEHFMGRLSHAEFLAHIEEIKRFEQMLADDGAVFLKVMFMLSKEQNRRSTKKMLKGRSAWKVSDDEVEISKHFIKRFKHASMIVDELISATNTPWAPWVRLDSSDSNYRDLAVGDMLGDVVRARLDAKAAPSPKAKPAKRPKPVGPTVLDALDLTKALDRETYKARLDEQQRRLTALTLGKKFERRSLVAVFEGNDAAGKGSSIRRVVQALDPRMIKVVPTAAPSDEERAQPYLWRFWRHVPRQGNITIFDRSWYGRVLVERVEGYCTEAAWTRAYREIRDFEAELADYGVMVVKFWLAVDKQEQLRRFKEREKIGYKRYKITDEDWRNRRKWNDYAQAVHDMVRHTDTPKAPWVVVEANDKYYARVKVLKAINARLEAGL